MAQRAYRSLSSILPGAETKFAGRQFVTIWDGTIASGANQRVGPVVVWDCHVRGVATVCSGNPQSLTVTLYASSAGTVAGGGGFTNALTPSTTYARVTSVGTAAGTLLATGQFLSEGDQFAIDVSGSSSILDCKIILEIEISE